VVWLAALAVALGRLLLRPAWPDDYDAIGFVRAVEHFDLAALQPHFPGYPIYVAAAKALHAIGLQPLVAAQAVSAIAAGATAAALFACGRALASAAAGWIALALFAVAALPFRLGTAALSDATAIAFAAIAAASLCRGWRATAALCAALVVGTRASDWPLAASLLALALLRANRREALRAVAAALAGTLAWAVPLLAVVGARAYVEIGRAHLAGHFAAWGGTIATRPGVGLRAFAFARALVWDGIAPSWLLLGLALAVALARPRPTRRALAIGALVAVPYALWALLAQNIVEQPRHLAPLTVALLLGCALPLARRPPLAALAVAAVAAGSLPLMFRARTEPPAAVQAATWAAAHYAPADTVVFGARAARFFTLPAHPRGWLSEVDVDLERLDRLPPHILVTDELEPDPMRARRLVEKARFCRDERLDRQQPCLTLYEYCISPECKKY
jgi:hypothetical protein